MWNRSKNDDDKETKTKLENLEKRKKVQKAPMKESKNRKQENK